MHEAHVASEWDLVMSRCERAIAWSLESNSFQVGPNMATTIFFLLGLSAITAIMVSIWVLCRFHAYEKQVDKSRTEGRSAFEALGQLHSITTRVAVDMDQHSDQVTAINESLIAAAIPSRPWSWMPLRTWSS